MAAMTNTVFGGEAMSTNNVLMNTNNNKKDNKTSNYKGFFNEPKNEGRGEAHSYEFGAHFRYKDLVSKLEGLKREQLVNKEIEESNKKLKLIDETTTKFLKTIENRKAQNTFLFNQSCLNKNKLNLEEEEFLLDEPQNQGLKRNYSLKKLGNSTQLQEENSFLYSRNNLNDFNMEKSPLMDKDNPDISTIYLRSTLARETTLRSNEGLKNTLRNLNIVNLNSEEENLLKREIKEKAFKARESIPSSSNTQATQSRTKYNLPQLKIHSMKHRNEEEKIEFGETSLQYPDKENKEKSDEKFANILQKMKQKISLANGGEDIFKASPKCRINTYSNKNVFRNPIQDSYLFRKGTDSSIYCLNKKVQINYLQNKCESVDKKNYLRMAVPFNSNDLNSKKLLLNQGKIRDKFIYQGINKTSDFLSKVEATNPKTNINQSFQTQQNRVKILSFNKNYLPNLQKISL